MGFTGAQFKKFDTPAEAEEFVRGTAKPSSSGIIGLKPSPKRAVDADEGSSKTKKVKPAGQSLSIWAKNSLMAKILLLLITRTV